MEANIIQGLLNCSLTEEDSQLIPLDTQDIQKEVDECSASLYFKILMEKESEIGIRAFAIVKIKAWDCRNIQILQKCPITFHLFFSTKEDCEKVLASSPSCFEYCMVALRPWNPRRTSWRFHKPPQEVIDFVLHYLATDSLAVETTRRIISA